MAVLILASTATNEDLIVHEQYIPAKTALSIKCWEQGVFSTMIDINI